jgi:hypothetical protein
VIDVQEGKVLANKDLNISMLVSSMVFSSDSKRLYFSEPFAEAIVYSDIHTGKAYQTKYTKKGSDKPVSYDKMLCAGNGKLYAASGKSFSIIDEAEMKVLKTLTGHDTSISSAA